ncbi:Polyketide cyclase / dehydrase and lipid transport [Lignipirellula cremea]|uniref:Polyketide cyclase / dehydrase and lipid transport n=2 Tax=Lignipirellula cremea TaxID=2528010 RepID=A0A518E3Q2_9BACT|nr:Polyketide cyclase / dehydrase and lipid transport [Lignipirellula cremea]
MKPITFACRESLPLSPADIAGQILDLQQWTDFQGYGLLPGIASAEFEERTAEVVGTRIRVVNQDDSRHVEEILAWNLESGLTLRMHDFSRPLSGIATHFLEHWRMEPTATGTDVTRSFELYPRSWLTRPLLWLISFPFQKAIARHLQQLRSAAD